MLVQKIIAGGTFRSGTRGLASALLSRSENDWLAKSANDLRKEAKARGLSQFVVITYGFYILLRPVPVTIRNGSKVTIARRLMKAEQQAMQSVPQASAVAATSGPTPSSSVCVLCHPPEALRL